MWRNCPDTLIICNASKRIIIFTFKRVSMCKRRKKYLNYFKSMIRYNFCFQKGSDMKKIFKLF